LGIDQVSLVMAGAGVISNGGRTSYLVAVKICRFEYYIRETYNNERTDKKQTTNEQTGNKQRIRQAHNQGCMAKRKVAWQSATLMLYNRRSPPKFPHLQHATFVLDAENAVSRCILISLFIPGITRYSLPSIQFEGGTNVKQRCSHDYA
jgi:hypothetical protein